MPMELLYDQPYLQTQVAPLSGFPQTIDFLINGREYVGNTSFEPYRRDAFRHRSIQPQRESIDLTNIPGEGTINTEGLWRRSADDWHFGAGQPYQDRKGSVDARFEESKGINPWMQWQCQLLNDTVLSRPLAGNGQVLVAGQTLLLLDLTASTVYVYLSPGTWSPVFISGGGITRIATDGYNVWASTGSASDGIWTANTSAIGSWSQYVTSGNFDGVWYVGDRLMATSGPNVYNIIAGGSPPTALWTHPNASFTFIAMCSSASFIYMAGSAAGQSNSTVYRTTIEQTGTALQIPVQALPMEGGEYVTSLYGYLQFVFVGTNLGVRMCRALSQYDPTGDAGDLEAGPLEPGLFPPGPVSHPVQAMVGNNRFMYFGWSDYDSVSTGIGRMDLSTFIDTQAPAFTSDLMVTGQGLVTSMDWNPINNAPIFVVQGKGVYTDSGNVLASGFIDSGLIGYGIPDDKILWAGDIGTVSPQYGSAAMSIAVDNNSDSALSVVGTKAASSSTNQSPFATPQLRGEQYVVRMTLYSDPSANQGPILNRWTIKALPAITAGTTISAVILLYGTASARGADQYFDPYAEYQFLYNLRTTQTMVQYQEGPFSAMCVIDELDWLPFKESDANTEGGFIGDIIVYLRTMDIGA